MLKLLPLILMMAYGYLMWRFSAAQGRLELASKSQPLSDPNLQAQADMLAKALDLPQIKVNIFDSAIRAR